MKKRILSIVMVALLSLGMFAGCTGVDVTPIATINGMEVLKSEYLFYCEQLGLNIASMYIQYGYDVDTLWEQQYTEDMTMADYVKTASMEQLIEVNVLASKAEEMGITLTAEEKQTAQDNKKSLVSALGSASAYKEIRNKLSLTDSEIVAIYEKMALATKVQEAIMEEDERFTSIDETAVGEWYETNYLKAKHILVMNTYQEPAPAATEVPVEGEEVVVTEVPTVAPVEPTMTPDEYKEDAKVRAQGLLDQVLTGADFDSLMKEYSEDPGSQTSPDGYVFTEGEMVAEFENAVKGLEAGAVTETLVESSYGWHIIKRLALTSADKDFTENYETYLETYEQTVWSELITELREAAEVVVDEKVQAKVDLQDLYWEIF